MIFTPSFLRRQDSISTIMQTIKGLLDASLRWHDDKTIKLLCHSEPERRQGEESLTQYFRILRSAQNDSACLRYSMTEQGVV
jgi:ferritin